MAKLKLDLHDIYNRGDQIDKELNRIIEEAIDKKIGLVEKVVPVEQLIPYAEDLAKRLARGPVAIGTIKKAINESLKMTLSSSLDYISRLQYQLCHTEDHEEAVTAWLEKRKAVFKGR